MTCLLWDRYTEEDLVQFKYWLQRNIHNWSTCDNFCNNTVGAFLKKFPGHVNEILNWAKSDIRWLQRAAADILNR